MFRLYETRCNPADIDIHLVYIVENLRQACCVISKVTLVIEVWRGHDFKSTDVFATTVNQKHTLVIVGENRRRINRFSFVVLLFLLHFKIHSVKRA